MWLVPRKGFVWAAVLWLNACYSVVVMSRLSLLSQPRLKSRIFDVYMKSVSYVMIVFRPYCSIWKISISRRNHRIPKETQSSYHIVLTRSLLKIAYLHRGICHRFSWEYKIFWSILCLIVQGDFPPFCNKDKVGVPPSVAVSELHEWDRRSAKRLRVCESLGLSVFGELPPSENIGKSSVSRPSPWGLIRTIRHTWLCKVSLRVAVWLWKDEK